jgi:ribonucleoside-diphosphate reductase alpha chain
MEYSLEDGGKTWGEVISMFIIAVLYPGVTMAMTAQTKANAAELLKDKYDEITRQYPWFKNEILKVRSAKDDFELTFVNGSRIDVLANAQTSKGQRRNRIQIEESALIDNYTFEDALKPIVEIGRTTQGKLGTTDPLEINQAISFFTTSGFRRFGRVVKKCTNV